MGVYPRALPSPVCWVYHHQYAAAGAVWATGANTKGEEGARITKPKRSVPEASYGRQPRACYNERVPHRSRRSFTRLATTLAVIAAGVAFAMPAAQSTPFMPVSDVRPGMVGIGRTVYSGTTIEDFRATVIGVLKNVIAPGRDLIVARLEGGPLAQTGVIAGMSGSPVYVDGKLIGAVSYALGSFPREPIAGITPIAEMIDAMRSAPDRTANTEFALSWPATPQQIYGALAKVVSRAASPVRSPLRPSDIVGAASLADWAPQLRPIGAAMMARGLAIDVEDDLREALLPTPLVTSGTGQTTAPSGALRPGDPVGMTFLRGDMEMGATGTVTYIDGQQVYAFGHAFLSQGPTTMPMTQATVLTVLPSLDSSMKIGAMGPVIGRMTQDRSVGVGGVLGRGPSELAVRVNLLSANTAARTFNFQVVHDQNLTPLFAFVSILNALSSFERASGPTTIAATGHISYGPMGRLEIDDLFTGDQALTQAASTALNPIGALATNTFHPMLPESMEVTLRVTEEEDHLTIERAWLDTVRPVLGGTHTLHVQLRRYRGQTETVSLPVTMPARVTGPVTLLVSDAPTLIALEQNELRPAPVSSLDGLLVRLRDSRANHQLHVRLLTAAPGTAIAGESQAALPSSVQSALGADTSAASTALTRTVVGAWHLRLPRVVRGSREIPLTLRANR